MKSPVSLMLIVCGVAASAAHAAHAAVDAARVSDARAEAALRQELPLARTYRTDAGRLTTVYGPGLSTGPSALDSAVWFVQRQEALLGAGMNDLANHSLLEDQRPQQPVMLDRATGDYRFTLVYFAQERAGVPVFGGELRVLCRNEPGFPAVLVRSGLRDLKGFTPPADLAGKLITQGQMQRAAVADGKAFANFGASSVVIWAGVEDQSPEPRLALKFIADNGLQGTPQFDQRLFIVDALTGALLYSESQVLDFDVAGAVRGNATDSFRADTCDDEVPHALPYLAVSVGGNTVYADVDGAYSAPTSGPGPFSLSATMSGRYFQITDAAGPVDSINQNGSAGTPADFFFNAANTSEFVRAQMNAYLNINTTRDIVVAANPSYPTIPTQTTFPVTVNVAGSCNAFYLNNAVNFYRAGGGCPNMTIPTVVAHEYGHHVVQMGGSGQGAYGEGMGDVMGVLLSDDPLSGAGFNGDCNVGGRTADNNINFPCANEAHYCGQVISGAVWETRNALAAAYPSEYKQILNPLVIDAVLLHIGTSIARDITIDYLTLDDNDGNVLNGSPHYPEIAHGFSAHNLTPPAGVDPIAITFPDGRPTIADDAGPTVFRMKIRNNSGTLLPGGVAFATDLGDGPQRGTLVQTGDGEYNLSLPAAPCGSPVRFYVSASAASGELITEPPNAPTSMYTAVSASSGQVVLNDALDTDSGWTVGVSGEAVQSGTWVRGVPAGNNSQSDGDHTPGQGGSCFYTGAAGDVDYGSVTLTSPRLDLSSATRPKISYWRWFSNNQGVSTNLERFVIRISNDDGFTWTTVETVGPGGVEARGGWIQHEVDVAAFVTPTANVKLRFVASDQGPDSTVEAAIDDLTVTNFTCDAACPGDWNDDAVVNSADFFDFLTGFFASNADFNASGATDSQDFFDFIAAFFAGC